jgi:hypothetical protein
VQRAEHTNAKVATGDSARQRSATHAHTHLPRADTQHNEHHSINMTHPARVSTRVLRTEQTHSWHKSARGRKRRRTEKNNKEEVIAARGSRSPLDVRTFQSLLKLDLCVLAIVDTHCVILPEEGWYIVRVWVRA